MASDNTDTTLLTGTEQLRNDLAARNLYTPLKEYPLQDKANAVNVVNTINTVIKGIVPFSSYDLTNTVYGRLITENTPLTEIGLVMLGKQFALNSISHLAQQKLPSIKPANLWDGSKDTKLFTLKENFSITTREDQGGFSKFLENFHSYYPTKHYPFTKTTLNSDIIKNTGTAQLNMMYANINRNVFKQDERLDSTFVEYAEVADTEIFPASTIINTGITKFFNYNDGKFDPYLGLGLGVSDTSVLNANNSMINSVLGSIVYTIAVDMIEEILNEGNVEEDHG